MNFSAPSAGGTSWFIKNQFELCEKNQFKSIFLNILNVVDHGDSDSLWQDCD